MSAPTPSPPPVDPSELGRRRVRPLPILVGLLVGLLLLSIGIRVVAGLRGPDRATGENPDYCDSVQRLVSIAPMTEAIHVNVAELQREDPESQVPAATLFWMLSPEDAPPRLRAEAQTLEAHLRAGSGSLPTPGPRTASPEVVRAAEAVDAYAASCNRGTAP